MKINKGDKFLCIKDVWVSMSKGNLYTKGNVYTSGGDSSITDNFGGKSCRWDGISNFRELFKPLKDVDRMYTEATDRLRELHRNFTGDKIGNPDEADHFDNKGIINDDFAFSAQVACEEFYKKDGYDYVSEEVFIKLNGLEEKPYDEDPYSWVNNGIREAGSRKEVNINTQPHCDKPKQYAKGIDTFARMEANCTKEECLAFIKGNIDKYNWRLKGQDKEDFEKI